MSAQEFPSFAGMTAFYMFRLMGMTFWGGFAGPGELWDRIHESPRVMTIPLILLAIPSVLLGMALGLLQQAPADWFGRGSSSDDDIRIQALIDERAIAKKTRDFARSDAIRDQLARDGVLLEDTPQGVRWKRA